MYRIHFAPMISSEYLGRVKQTSKGWTHQGYRTSCNVLVIMLSGECMFTFPEQKRAITVSAGQAALIPNGVYYSGSCEHDCEYYFFHFYNAVTELDEASVRANIRKAEQEAAAADPLHHLRHAPAVLDQLYMAEVTEVTAIMKPLAAMLAELDAENQKTDVNRMLRRDLTICRIIAAICETAMSDLAMKQDYPASLSRILAYIYEHYTEKLTLDGLSVQFGLSKQHIIRMFRRYLGTTVTRFINDLKLSHAPELLCHSTLNVSEIAAYLGFSSSFYFSRLFREKYSVPPTRYANVVGAEIAGNRDRVQKQGQKQQ